MGVGPWSTGISVLIRRDTKELAPFPTLRKKKERKKGGKEEKEGEMEVGGRKERLTSEI